MIIAKKIVNVLVKFAPSLNSYANPLARDRILVDNIQMIVSVIKMKTVRRKTVLAQYVNPNVVLMDVITIKIHNARVLISV